MTFVANLSLINEFLKAHGDIFRLNRCTSTLDVNESYFLISLISFKYYELIMEFKL